MNLFLLGYNFINFFIFFIALPIFFLIEDGFFELELSFLLVFFNNHF